MSISVFDVPRAPRWAFSCLHDSWLVTQATRGRAIELCSSNVTLFIWRPFISSIPCSVIAIMITAGPDYRASTRYEERNVT